MRLHNPPISLMPPPCKADRILYCAGMGLLFLLHLFNHHGDRLCREAEREEEVRASRGSNGGVWRGLAVLTGWPEHQMKGGSGIHNRTAASSTVAADCCGQRHATAAPSHHHRCHHRGWWPKLWHNMVGIFQAGAAAAATTRAAAAAGAAGCHIG